MPERRGGDVWVGRKLLAQKRRPILCQAKESTKVHHSKEERVHEGKKKKVLARGKIGRASSIKLRYANKKETVLRGKDV